jgi:hypothetical protein
MRRVVGSAVVAGAVAGLVATAAQGVSADEGTGTTCHLAQGAASAVATCHNPDPTTGHVQLHVACARWWDPPTDSATVTVDPAQWVTVSGRCWKEIRTAWVTVS